MDKKPVGPLGINKTEFLERLRQDGEVRFEDGSTVGFAAAKAGTVLAEHLAVFLPEEVLLYALQPTEEGKKNGAQFQKGKMYVVLERHLSVTEVELISMRPLTTPDARAETTVYPLHSVFSIGGTFSHSQAPLRTVTGVKLQFPGHPQDYQVVIHSSDQIDYEKIHRFARTVLAQHKRLLEVSEPERFLEEEL